MVLSLVRRAALAAASALALPAALAAQSVEPVGAASPPHTQVISFQPLNAIALVFSGEYERKLGVDRSLGVGASYYNDDEDGAIGFRYVSAEVKGRYYPQSRALEGFSVGVSAGVTSVSAQAGNDVCLGDPACEGSDESATSPTIGALVEYQWLLGRERKFAVALGAGAKRLLSSDVAGAASAYPTVRISIGWAY